jgi:hypothetical protein
MFAFSMPLLQHINDHRRAAGPKIGRDGPVIMHEHLEHVLANLIVDELTRALPITLRPQMPTDLVGRYVASTFVLVLNWWVDRGVELSPADVNARFRDLVVPTLTGILGQSEWQATSR